MIYRFYDTDVNENEEYDVIGEEYDILINTCCKYSSVLALNFMSKDILYYNELEKYKIASKRLSKQWIVNYYKMCPELCELLLKITDSIFKWIDGRGFKNPEDPCFYREDGTLFFDSSIHEGILKLMPRENEDVSKIISNPLWIPETDDVRKSYW